MRHHPLPRLAMVAAVCIAAGLTLVAAAQLSAPPPRREEPAPAPSQAQVEAPHEEGCGAGKPAPPPPQGKKRVLRISADPNNLPFTNEKQEGFENKIAELIAADLGTGLEYIWRAQRRGFFRQALKEGECDLVLGVPAGFDMALTTAPYYRSTYVFVTRRDRHLKIQSLDDPVLKRLEIGVQMIGNDAANTPPAHALARRGIIDNVHGYMIYGDYREESPPARIIEAVANKEVDVALAWGPMAGYFAKRQRVALELTPVKPEADPPGLRFVFAIAMGVRKGDKALRDELNAVLERRRADINKILDEYGVPRVSAPARKPERQSDRTRRP